MLQQILFVHLRGFSFGGAPTSVLTFGPVVVGWLLLNRCGVFASGLIDTFFFKAAATMFLFGVLAWIGWLGA